MVDDIKLVSQYVARPLFCALIQTMLFIVASQTNARACALLQVPGGAKKPAPKPAAAAPAPEAAAAPAKGKKGKK